MHDTNMILAVESDQVMTSAPKMYGTILIIIRETEEREKNKAPSNYRGFHVSKSGPI